MRTFLAILSILTCCFYATAKTIEVSLTDRNGRVQEVHNLYGVSTDYKGSDVICGNIAMSSSLAAFFDESKNEIGPISAIYGKQTVRFFYFNKPTYIMGTRSTNWPNDYFNMLMGVTVWTSGTPFDLSAHYIKGKTISRWERSTDNGSHWTIVKQMPQEVDYLTNFDYDHFVYREENPQKGEICYRQMYSDGSYSDIVRMHIYDAVPLSIATKPLTQTSTVDESVTLTLDVADDNYSYQWYHNGSAIEGATAATYSIAEIKAADAGEYYCKISNPASSTNSTPMTLTVNKCPQEINFPELQPVTFGETTSITLPKLTNKGLTISYQCSNPSVATVSGNVVTIHAPGSTNITANQHGDANYLEAAYITRQLTVNKRNQVIDFPEITPKTFGDLPFALPLTTDEGLTISYSSLNQQVATINGNIVTITGAGTSDIIATQAGDATHNAAVSVSRVLTVNKQSQSINFQELSPKTYGDAPIVLNETSNRGLVISYTSDSDIVTVDNNRIIINKPGRATITATQPGNKNYLPAQPVSRTIIIYKAGQSLTLSDFPNKTYGDDPIALPATTDKELSVIYESSNNDIIKISGNIATITGAGTAQITASQPGNEYYSELAPQTITVSVSKSLQTIVFPELHQMTFGDSPLQLSAIASSGMDVVYESSDPGVAAVEGTTLTVNGAGRCYITASAPGNNNYYSASPVERELIVNRANQTIVFGESLTKTYGDEPFILQASATAGGALTFATSNPSVITVNGQIATVVGAGRAEITAQHSGNNNYNNASAKMIVTVEKASLIATANNQSREYGLENPPLTISYQGFVNEDSDGDLADKIRATTPANQNSNIGTYDITLEPIADQNYNITYRKGSLTITKAPLTVTANDAEKFYGDSNPEFKVTYSGFRNGQTESELLNRPACTTTAKTMSKVGTYPIYVSGAEARNYEISYQSGILTVNKSTLTAHLQNSQREYGQENSYQISYTGFRGSDNKECINVYPSISTDADRNSNVGTYPMTLIGGESDNYLFAFSYPNGQESATLTITKANLTIKADDKSMEYLSALPRFTMSFTGFRNNDTQDDLDQFPHIYCEANQQSAPGVYPITLSGGHDRNYEFTLVDGILTIEGQMPVYVSSILLDPQQLTLAETEEASINITLYPENATNKDVVWTTSDSNVAEVHNGHIIALSPGQVFISATATDGSAVTASCLVTVTPKSSISEITGTGKEEIEVFDMRGVKVGDSLKGLPHGIYIIRQGSKTFKQII